jgi:2,4-dienoyl-CoA reductase-like NADH-dependent reductase (Old Yellow Enzyme family)/thioredoxin reductase
LVISHYTKAPNVITQSKGFFNDQNEEVNDMSGSYPKLLEPGMIGNIQLKNRMIKAPQHTGLANPDGSVTDRMIRHYKETALGGCGLVIVEYAYVDNDASRASPCQLSISTMDHIPGLSLLSQTIQANGAKAAIQISHAGRQKFTLSRPIKAPSAVPWEEMHAMGCPPPDVLTFEEIGEIVKSFGMAAKRAQLADFDMVEIHGCHGYLISNFLSPRTNKRTDWYGGSLENRMRFLLEVIEEIMRQVGPDYPVCVRLSGIDYEPDGTTIEETIELSRQLEAMGVAVIHMSGGNHHQTIHEISPIGMPPANNVWAAEAVKKEINIPVIASGSLNSPDLAEQVLREGKGDFVALGRPLWADPYFPKKIAEGRPEDIRPCIRCNDGCLARGDHLAKTVACSVNVALCREEEFRIIKAQDPKKVAVVGGGPAGMEAARVCALRGHDVTLYEKRKLGGVLLEAAIPDFKMDLRPFIQYLSTQVEKLNVKVLYEEATAKGLISGGYNAVIVATGANLVRPDIPGIDGPNVTDALQVLNNEAETGEKVALIGAGMVGTEVGLYLSEQGKEVVFIEMMDSIMNGTTPDEKQVYEKRFKEFKVSFHTGQRLESVSGKNIITIDRFGRRTEMTVDSVVLASGFRPDRGLIEDLMHEATLQVAEAGDCVSPRKVLDAIKDGHLAAKLLK